eukprot:3917063-Pyramimonas_sp.AAC.1
MLKLNCRYWHRRTGARRLVVPIQAFVLRYSLAHLLLTPLPLSNTIAATNPLRRTADWMPDANILGENGILQW